MKRDRFEEVADLFRQACQREPAKRAAFLDEACGQDVELRAQVDALLAADETRGTFLPESGMSERAARQAVEVLADETRGRHKAIGNYRILDLLGEGGMGLVYLAEQTEPMRRMVALKLIKLGMDTERVLARFDAERQALAMMDHPNVAQVYDGGMTDSGRSYFVMEYVKGIPITEYCDKERLTTAERLDLFLQVCEAIQHAHQKGIIHRDIKPTNVLVMLQDGKPVPKVIDFGVAKATSQRLTEKTLFTEQGQFVGTPEYMSPEQAEMSGLNVDTRTDVYSLGVLLYELLTGVLPFEPRTIRKAALNEVQRIIREEDPPRPSTRLSSLDSAELSGDDEEACPSTSTISRARRIDLRSLARLLRGDLDWIVMKALEKNRTRRYESASALAADIRRHLNHEPVEAGPPGAAYRMRKYIRRNRGLVIAAAAVSLALSLGIVGTTAGMLWAMNEASRAAAAEVLEQEQRLRAEHKARVARSIAEFFDRDLFVGADAGPSAGSDLTVRNLLSRAERSLNRRSFIDPVDEAALRATLGNAYYSLGLLGEAEPHLRRALVIRQGLYDDPHPDVAASLNDLGEVLTYDRQQASEAHRLLRSALDMRRVLSGDQSWEYADSLRALGRQRFESTDWETAESCYRQALHLYRDAFDPKQEDVAKCAGELGMVLREMGEYDEAESLFRESIAVYESLFGEGHPATSNPLWNLARLYKVTGRFGEALAAARRSLALDSALYGEVHTELIWDHWLIGDVLVQVGTMTEACAHLQRALELCEELPDGSDRPKTFIVCSLVDVLSAQQRWDEAEMLGLQWLETLEQRYGLRDRWVLAVTESMADLYASWQEAEPDKGYDAKAAEWRAKLTHDEE